jgi:hypothetical protein
MAFDNPDFGRKNYERYLRAARETLLLKYLTDDDHKIIERGIYHLIRGMICSSAKIQNLCEKPRGSFWSGDIISGQNARCRTARQNTGRSKNAADLGFALGSAAKKHRRGETTLSLTCRRQCSRIPASKRKSWPKNLS